MAEASAPDSSAKRAMGLVVFALLLAAAALWGSSELTWFAELRHTGVRGVVMDTESGAQRSAALVPLALLALAGVAGAVATGGWARRVLGAILLLAGGAVAVSSVVGVHLGEASGYPTWEVLAGHGLAAAGGVLLAVSGIVVVRLARRMPRLGARYSAPGDKPAARDPDTEMWDSLSAGDDPTRNE